MNTIFEIEVLKTIIDDMELGTVKTLATRAVQSLEAEITRLRKQDRARPIGELMHQMLERSTTWEPQLLDLLEKPTGAQLAPAKTDPEDDSTLALKYAAHVGFDLGEGVDKQVEEPASEEPEEPQETKAELVENLVTCHYDEQGKVVSGTPDFEEPRITVAQPSVAPRQVTPKDYYGVIQAAKRPSTWSIFSWRRFLEMRCLEPKLAPSEICARFGVTGPAVGAPAWKSRDVMETHHSLVRQESREAFLQAIKEAPIQ